MKNNLFIKRTVMKLFSVLLGMSLFGNIMLAGNGFGQNLKEVTVQLTFENAPVEKVLETLNKKTGYNFLYNEKVVRSLDKKITLHSNATENMKEVLSEIANQTGLSFRCVNENIAVKLTHNSTVSEDTKNLFDKTITGKVTDAETGEPLIGATVRVKGTTIGTVTDANGNYTIEVPDDAGILSFTYVGYQPFETTLSTESVVNVQLSVDVYSMEEVVITALGFKNSRTNLGYSVGRIDNKEVSTVKNTNLKTSLLGKVSGVNVTPVRNGMGGSQRITIRGISSISRNNQPLWIVDGVPIYEGSFGSTNAIGGIDYGDPLSGIDPDNIESISVLRSNAAAALYGSRAANGVILITTKSGKNENGISVDLNLSFLIDQPIDLTDWQYLYGQGSQGKIPQNQDQALAWGTSNWGEKFNGQTGVQFDGVERPYKPFPDNFKNYYQNGLTGIYSLGINGESKNDNYRIALSRQDSKDILPNSGYERNTIGFNANTHFKKLEIQVNTHYFNENGKNRARVGGNYSNPDYGFFCIPVSLDVNMLKPGYYPDGTEMTFGDHPSETNPFFVANKIKQEDSKNHLIGALTAKLPFGKGFYLKTRIMQDYLTFRNRYSTSKGVAWNPRGGGLDEEWSESLQSNYEIIGGYEKDLKLFSLNSFVGGNILKIVNRGVNVSGNPFALEGIYSINNLQSRNVTSDYSEEQTNSLFGSLQFGWLKRAYLTFTGRTDWFSTLPKENNHLFYPSVSLSILPVEWWPHNGFITFNQLRLSAAKVSGGTSPYQLNLGYSLDAQSYNGQSIQYISSSKIPNKNLQPFLSTEYDFGVNLGFLSNRLLLDITFYDKNIKNDIVSSSVSPTTGFSSAILNVGKVTNKGIEFNLSGTLLRATDFSVLFSGNFSYNKNDVVSLGNSLETVALQRAKYSNSAYIHIDQSEPYATIQGTTFLRNDQGEIVYDENGYPIVNPESKILGYGIPNKLAGLSFTLNYKNFSLYVLFDGKFGADIFSETNKLAIQKGKHKMTLEGRESGLSVSGVDENNEPFSTLITPENLKTYYNNYAKADEPFVESADFIKFRELAIGYTVPAKKLGNIFKSVQFQITGNNLAILYKKTANIDPESNLTSSDVQGFETFGYPSVRRVGFNLNLKF